MGQKLLFSVDNTFIKCIYMYEMYSWTVFTQLVKNYLPISLLNISGKMFERMFNFLNQNDLISPAQFGFKPGDSCINQLLSIIHEIYHSMDEGYETWYTKSLW